MTVVFDTLKLARRPQGAGFSREQADGAAEALADTFTSEIATKSDLAELKAALKAELNAEIATLRSDTAKWIVSGVFVNILTSVGLAAAIWQLAHK